MNGSLFLPKDGKINKTDGVICSQNSIKLNMHIPDKIVIVKQLKNNLYGMDPEDVDSFTLKEKCKEKNI